MKPNFEINNACQQWEMVIQKVGPYWDSARIVSYHRNPALPFEGVSDMDIEVVTIEFKNRVPAFGQTDTKCNKLVVTFEHYVKATDTGMVRVVGP